MTYATFIALLRQDAGDFPIRCFETADGDGSTTVFNLQNFKVYENSYVVQVGGITQIEGTAYTMYPDVGQIVFNTGYAPAVGNDNVSFQYQKVVLRDADYIDIINQIFQQLRRKIWIEAVDWTTLSTVTDQNIYDLAPVKTAGGYTDIIYVIDFQVKELSNSSLPPAELEDGDSIVDVWRSARTVTNMRYYRDIQKIWIRPAFNTSGFPLRVYVIRAYNQGNATSSPFELQERYWPMFRKFCQAEYLNRLVGYLLKNSLTTLAKENTYENLNDLRKMVTDVTNQANMMLKVVRPSKPAQAIPVALFGIGNI